MLYDHVFQPEARPFCSWRRCSSTADEAGESADFGTLSLGGVAPAAMGSCSFAHRTPTPAVASLATGPGASDLA